MEESPGDYAQSVEYELLNLSTGAAVVGVDLENPQSTTDDLFQDNSHGKEKHKEIQHSQYTQVNALHALAKGLIIRYEDSDRNLQQDLDIAIILFRKAVEITRQSVHSNPAIPLEMLAYALSVRANDNHRSQKEDLNEAIEVRKEALITVPSTDSFRRAILTRLGINLVTRFNHGRQECDFDEIISIHKDMLHLPSNSNEEHALSLINLGNMVYQRFELKAAICDVEESISLWKQAANLIPQDNPNQSLILPRLASALRTRFSFSSIEEDLKESISLYRQAILRPQPNAFLYESITDLAEVLEIQFQHGGASDLGQLEEAIQAYRQALQLMPTSHFNYADFINKLALALRVQFKHTNQLELLEESILLHKKTLHLRPHPHPSHSGFLNNLAGAFQIQFKHRGGLHYLEEAISFHRQALQLRPYPHPEQSSSLNNLGLSLQAQFDNGGGIKYIEEAIIMHRKALQLRPYPHPDHSTSLNNLAHALHAQFKHTGFLDNLEEAITLYRQACLNPEDYDSMTLNNLASALMTRFNHKGGIEYLEEAVFLHRQALQLRPYPHPDHSGSLHNLAITLRAQFECGGGLHCLEEAVILLRQAVNIKHSSHPNYCDALNDLAAILSTQFQHRVGSNNLDDAISLYRQGLQLRPYPHPGHSTFLINLALALQSRFEGGGGTHYIEEAIALLRQAVKVTPYPHPAHCISMSSLATALQGQYKHTGLVDYIEEAIFLGREVLRLRSYPHPDHSDSLINLASAFRAQFARAGNPNQLKEAISLLEPVLEHLPQTTSAKVPQTQTQAHDLQLQHSHQSMCYNLALLSLNAHVTFGGSEGYLDKAMSLFLFLTHAPSISPFTRFVVAAGWAEAADLYWHNSAMEAYNLSIQLLPQVNSLDHSMKQRHEAMATSASESLSNTTARNAPRYAIRMQQFDKAIEFSEAARAILWSQIIQFRSPFERLSSEFPKLGERLNSIARELDYASHNESIHLKKYMPGNKEPLRLTHLAMEWQTKLEQVRKLEGFGDFLLPHRASSLQRAAGACPIAILIHHEEGSCCLILTPETIYHIAIPTFTTTKLRDMATDIQMATFNASRAQGFTHSEAEILATNLDSAEETLVNEDSDRLGARRVNSKGMKPDIVFRSVLAELWNELVRPVINILGIKKSSRRATVQWCPTGLFTFLPIHAAGIYISEATADSSNSITIEDWASNYIVSSYTPTIGALLQFIEDPPSPNEFKMLTIAMTSALYHAKQELQNIKARVPNDSLVEVGVNGIAAQVNNIVSHLPTASIVHFACHGVQDRSNPLHSGLVLEDGLLTIAKIMENPLPNGSLAFLGACETAMGDKILPDEAMSVGASLVFSGFRSVIATMWKIMDHHGPTIADSFYEELFRGSDGSPRGTPDFTRSALALDIAVQKLRATGVPFHEWVPFVHLGKVN